MAVNVKREICDEDAAANGDAIVKVPTTTTTIERQHVDGHRRSPFHQEGEEDDDDDDDDPHRLRIKESITNECGAGGASVASRSRNDRQPVVIKTESSISRHTSPDSAASAAGSSDHVVIVPRSWANGAPVRPDIIFSHRRAGSNSPPTPLNQHKGLSPPPPPITLSSSSSSSFRGSVSPPGQTPDQTQRPSSSRVPSVVLGQSGGVKTMVWTGHWADSQQQPSRPRSESMSAIRPVSNTGSGGGKLHKLDNNDPSVRLSVDGLLSLAAQSAEQQQQLHQRRHSVSISRASPPQV